MLTIEIVSKTMELSISRLSEWRIIGFEQSDGQWEVIICNVTELKLYSKVLFYSPKCWKRPASQKPCMAEVPENDNTTSYLLQRGMDCFSFPLINNIIIWNVQLICKILSDTKIWLKIWNILQCCCGYVCLQQTYRGPGRSCVQPSCSASFPWWWRWWAWSAPPVWQNSRSRSPRWLWLEEWSS